MVILMVESNDVRLLHFSAAILNAFYVSILSYWMNYIALPSATYFVCKILSITDWLALPP